MSLTNQSLSKIRLAVALAGTIACLLVADAAQSATVFFQTGASGGGSQNVYMPSNAISGTMLAPVPRFNGLLGTLIQADFEWFGETTGSWTSIGNPIGTSTINIAGPSDVGGQAMGTLAAGFVSNYVPINPSNDYNGNFTNITFTSGVFFNSLTGAGTVPMTWVYSGSSSLDTPAVGVGFAWGGSVHVLYTYVPVPEPSTLPLAGIALCGMFTIARRRRRAIRG